MRNPKVFPMGSTCRESDSPTSTQRNSEVFQSLWVRKDTTFRLNHSLLGNHFVQKGKEQIVTAMDNKQGRSIGFTADMRKRKFGIKTSVESQNSDSAIQDRSSKKIENLRLVPASAPNRELLSSKRDEPLKKYEDVLVLAQKQEAESLNQNGTSGEKSTRCSESNSAQNRHPEFSGGDATRGKHQSSCYCSGSKQSCLLESLSQSETLGNNDHCFIPSSNRTMSNASTDSGSKQSRLLESLSQNQTLEKNDHCFIPSSNRTASNASTDSDSDFLEERWSDNRVSSSSSSSDWERPRRKRTRMKRSKESGKRPPKTPKLKVHQCDFCPKRFSSRFARDVHHRIHTGERPFQCRSCSMTFTSKSSRKKHYQIHQPVLLKTCKTCGKGFRYNNSLRDHKKVHREWSGPHLCERCGREFGRKVFLDRHLLNCMKQ